MLRLLLSWCWLGLVVVRADQEEPRVLFLGDSITYDGRWVVHVESAMRAQRGLARIPIVNMAVPSETASGLSEPGHAGGSFVRPDVHERLGRVLTAYKPTLVIISYGINDGIFQPLDDARFKAYRDGLTSVRADCLKAGAKVVVLTPPPYGVDKPADAAAYDQVMATYSLWLVQQRRYNWQVIDVRTQVLAACAAAKKSDPKFIFARDSIHPGDEGHLMLAQATWEGLAPMMKWNVQAVFADPIKGKPLAQSMTLLRNAWLTKTGHKRPGLPVGLPLEQAENRSNALISEFLKTP
ncbi:MAG: GDSL-type esterase/lipase family protein [Verrucomicrobia bacterium]|nr:GDSL-type esterase/lipase family protein [Verrucomicrobiota bacterium]